MPWFPRPRSSPPNVRFLAVCGLRPELGSYGAGYIKRPQVGCLALTGVRIDLAYVQCALREVEGWPFLIGAGPIAPHLLFVEFDNHFDLLQVGDAPAQGLNRAAAGRFGDREA